MRLGGYDLRVVENVDYHHELEKLVETVGLRSCTAKNLVTALSVPDDVDVLFLLSVPSSLKTTLLRAASIIVYTPGMEHFGIVPLEAMLAGVPVLAADTGGPTETVVDGQTGWLRSVREEEQWTSVMQLALASHEKERLKAMGERGKARVQSRFSKETMARSLEHEMDAMARTRIRPALWPQDAWIVVALLCFTVSCLVAWARYI